MNPHFKFRTLPKACGAVANIFIHGYSAGHDLQDRRLLVSSIPASLQNCVNIFAFWPSGHFARVGSSSRSLFAAGARVHVAVGAAVFVGDRAVHFARIRSRAEEMGKVLMEQLQEYLFKKHPHVTTVNLIGHSLGGRLVVSALKSRTDPLGHGLAIDDVLLMAAAVEVTPSDAAQMESRINGRLINAYSRDDWTLFMNFGEASLGRNEVENFDNISMPEFGHGDYWKKLPAVMVQTKFKGYQGQQLAEGLGTVTAVDDFVRNDSIVYRVLERSPVELTEEAIKHLKTSSWTDIKDAEEDRAFSFTREFQLVGGHCLVNAARRRGLTYVDALQMLAEHYELGSKVHRCASVLETEKLLIKTFFQHAFPDGHPLANAPLTAAKVMSREVYFKHIDALAELLTVASYFKPSTVDVDMTDPSAGTAMASTTTIALAGYANAVAGLLGTLAKKPVSRLLTNFKTALKPGYSALIPAVAIVFYARVELDDEGLM